MDEVLLILTDNRACVASIIRTYYTWQMFESYDLSWGLGPMGLCAWAEVSIGIMAGCLPSLPRFLKHVGPKIYRCICGTGSGRGSNAVPHPPRSDTVDRVKTPFAKYGFGTSVSDPLDDLSIPSPQPHNVYLILGGVDASPLREMNLSATVGQPGGTATARDALEYGQ